MHRDLKAVIMEFLGSALRAMAIPSSFRIIVQIRLPFDERSKVADKNEFFHITHKNLRSLTFFTEG